MFHCDMKARGWQMEGCEGGEEGFALFDVGINADGKDQAEKRFNRHKRKISVE